MMYGEWIRSSDSDDVAAILIGDMLYDTILAVYDPDRFVPQDVTRKERLKLITAVKEALAADAPVPSAEEAKVKVNKVVESILGMHCITLL